MAGYGYMYRGYSTSNTPSLDDRSMSSYASDHVCRPVVIDAEGRKRPIISYGPDKNSEQYVTRTETVVQQVQSPFGASEYKHATRWDPLDGAEHQWREPLSPVNDRPQDFNEFFARIQSEASRPRLPAYWRPTPKFAGYDGRTGGYSEYKDMSNKDLLKPPSGNTYRNDDYDDYYRKQGSAMEPVMITSGGWARPSHSAWSAPPDASLSTPTTDINAAMSILKESAKPSVTTAPQSKYAESIDSREGARRYPKFNFAPRPYSNEDNYTTTIDSKEAARKYHGTTV